MKYAEHLLIECYASIPHVALQMKGAEGFQELAFFHKPSSTLILADLAFNFDDRFKHTEDPGMLFNLYLSLSGGNRRCCISKPLKHVIKDPSKHLQNVLAMTCMLISEDVVAGCTC